MGVVPPLLFSPYPKMTMVSSKTLQSPSFFANALSAVRCRVWVVSSSLSSHIVVGHRHHHPHPRCLLIVVFITSQGLTTTDCAVVIGANGVVVGVTAAKDDPVEADEGVKLSLLLSCSCCHCHPSLLQLCRHPPTHNVFFLFVGYHLFLPPFVWLIVVLG